MRVDMQCSWNGDTGTLDETFTYADGKRAPGGRSPRTTTNTAGTAADVVGEAVGAAWATPCTGSTCWPCPWNTVYNVHFNDWMWQLDDTIMMNRAVFSKFGIRLGEVFITFTDKTRGSGNALKTPVVHRFFRSFSS